jgi:hypothetical protein
MGSVFFSKHLVVSQAMPPLLLSKHYTNLENIQHSSFEMAAAAAAAATTTTTTVHPTHMIVVGRRERKG